MCIEGQKEIRCPLCGETLKLIPTTQFSCNEAKDRGFGSCGQIKPGKPAIFFTNGNGCPLKEKAETQEEKTEHPEDKNQELGETF